MSMITRAASYRGVVLEHAVGATTSGLPQMVVKTRALEFYDNEEKVWLPHQEEDNEITAYLVLFNKKGDPIFHTKDIMRVFEWDGTSLVALNELDLEGAEVQFEVAEHTYNDKTSMQVQNIRGYNDEPGNSLKKLDAAELGALSAKFGAQLKKLGGAPKVASAKAPAAPKKAVATATKTGTKKGNKRTAKAAAPKPPVAPTAEAAEAPVAELPVAEAIEEFNTAPKPPAAPKAKTETAAATTTTVANDTTTYEGAWAECVSRRAPGVDDEALAAAFQAAMYRIAPNVTEEAIEAGDWTKITDTVLSECGVF